MVDKRNLKENAQRAYDEEHEQLVGRIHAVQHRQEDFLLAIIKVRGGIGLSRGLSLSPMEFLSFFFLLLLSPHH